MNYSGDIITRSVNISAHQTEASGRIKHQAYRLKFRFLGVLSDSFQSPRAAAQFKKSKRLINY